MLKKLILAAAGLMIALPAFADGGHRHNKHYGHYKHRPHYQWKHHHRPVVVMPPPRVYYAPPPRVVYAPPPRPVYHAPAPSSGISIRLHFPL
ncbi:MAG TPA: hypothetical protein VFZ84_11310 [Burkholderiales bacterium]|jgi:hypothetical protein